MTSEITPNMIQTLGLREIDSPPLDTVKLTQGVENESAEWLLNIASGELLGALDTDHEEARAILQELAATLRDTRAEAEPRGEPLRVGDALVALRRLPVLTTRLEGAAPAWSVGLAAERRIGPIADQLGRNLWIDIFRRVRQLHFVRSPGGPPFLTLPIVQAGRAMSGTTLRTGQSLDITAGSLWFATSFFAAAPTNVYSGVRISRGSLRFSADMALGDDEVVVPPSVSVDLTLRLDPPVPGAPPPEGSEFAAARCRPPSGLEISIRPAGGAITVLGDAELAVWGAKVALTPVSGAPQYRADLNRLVLPMKPDRSSFAIGEVASALFVPSDEAPISAAGLALPAAVITPADLGEASGVGALMLELGRGLAATWQDEPRPVDLGPALMLLDESRLAFTGRAARAMGSAVRPHLAHLSEAAALAYTRLDKTAVHYLTSTDGAEAIVLSAAVDVRLPKPVDVAGNRVGTLLPTALVVISSTPAGERSLMLSGLSSVRPQERPVAFALTNAVLRATRPRAFFLMGRLEGNRVVEGLAFTVYGLGGLLPSLPDPYAANSGLGQRFGVASQGYLLSHFQFGPTNETLGFLLPPGVAADPPPAGPSFSAAQQNSAVAGIKMMVERQRASRLWQHLRFRGHNPRSCCSMSPPTSAASALRSAHRARWIARASSQIR